MKCLLAKNNNNKINIGKDYHVGILEKLHLWLKNDSKGAEE